jgi:hypothetical protein
MPTYAFIYICIYTAVSNGKRKHRRFSLIHLPFVHRIIRSLSFVHLLTKNKRKLSICKRTKRTCSSMSPCLYVSISSCFHVSMSPSPCSRNSANRKHNYMKTATSVCSLQTENGRRQTSVCLLKTEMENGSLFSLVCNR